VCEAGAEAPKKKKLHDRHRLHPPTSCRTPTVCLPPTACRPTTHQSTPTIMSRSPSPLLPEIKSLYVGQQFEDFPAFKTAMRMWAVSDPRKFTYRFKKSDKIRNNVVCVHAEKGCPFKVNATFSLVKECVTVIVVEDDHTCVGTAPVQRSIASTQAWLQEILPRTITITKATKPSDISDAVAHKHGVVIGYEAAKKAKKAHSR
jgi:hypothetical protein